MFDCVDVDYDELFQLSTVAHTGVHQYKLFQKHYIVTFVPVYSIAGKGRGSASVV